jgi:hypothetical protein
MSVCEALSARFDAMRQNDGLVDVKFLLGNVGEATTELVCAEVMSMLDAYDAGEYEDFKFNDSRVTR